MQRILTNDADEIIPRLADHNAALKYVTEVVIGNTDTLKLYSEMMQKMNSVLQMNRFRDLPEALLLKEHLDIIRQMQKERAARYYKHVQAKRKWANACYRDMKNHIPVATGNLRDSLFIMGSSFDDIDVDFDDETILKFKGKDWLPNIVPYKWEGKVHPVGALKIPNPKGYNYSWWADRSARKKRLRYFRTKYLEDLKEAMGARYGVVYAPKTYSDMEN